MAFSNNERERREKAMRAIMQARGLSALILFGDVSFGNDFYGDFRYYTDNRIITSRQVAVLFPDKEPVLLVGSAIQRQAASRRSAMQVMVLMCGFRPGSVIDSTKRERLRRCWPGQGTRIPVDR